MDIADSISYLGVFDGKVQDREVSEMEDNFEAGKRNSSLQAAA